jgi:GC-rich sequence DNA-binding factor
MQTASCDLSGLACKQVASTVFADASEDYSTVEAVKRRLEDWQRSYPAAYRDAYMPMSAPAIFAPFVRLDLLHWEVLFGRPASGGSISCSARSDF